MVTWSSQLASAALVFGALLFSACSSTPTTQQGAQGTPVPQGPYGSLVIMGNLGSGGIDPVLTTGDIYLSIGNAYLDTLLIYDDKDQVQPGIAERWEISDDGLSQTFYIRKGVKFQNGDDLTGADVKFSVERMMAPEVTHQDAAVWRAAITSVDLRDDYTVVFRMKQPQLELLKGMDGGMAAVMPKKYIGQNGVDYFQKHPMGSGPWKVVKFEIGNFVELEAVDSHWRKVPAFKNLTIRGVMEEASAVAQLKTGELDLALVAPDSVAGLKSAGIRIMTFDRGANYFIWPFFDITNPAKYALGDVRVRKAAQLAINQKEIGANLLGGNGGPKAMAYVNSNAYFWDPNQIRLDPYDPDGAKKLLTDAGYPNGFDTKLYDVGAGSILSTLGQAVAGYWRKVGMNIEIVPMDYGTFRLKYNPKQLPEIWNTFWIYRANYYRNFEGIPLVYHSSRSSVKNLNDPTLDALIDKIPQTKDAAEKKKLALEAAVRGHDAYTTLAAVEAYPTLALSAKVGQVNRTAAVVTTIWAAAFEEITHGK
ncbi:MAG: ABC transporter substrate-binding protein [Dehalococcoidia bacterium]|nr:ABC transporter substrate-binding protein [Dehalococcoidia bacterium]